MVLTDIEKLEWWIAHAQPEAQIVLLDGGNPRTVAQKNAGFAKVWETAQREISICLENDNQGRTVAVKKFGVSAVLSPPIAPANIPYEQWGSLPPLPDALKKHVEQPTPPPPPEPENVEYDLLGLAVPNKEVPPLPPLSERRKQAVEAQIELQRLERKIKRIGK